MNTRRREVAYTMLGAVLGAAVVLAATAALGVGAPAAPGGSPDPAPSASAQPSPVHYEGAVTLTPSRGEPGTAVTVAGSGFQPGAQVAVVWNTVKGSWKLEGTANEEFVGRAFEPVRTPVASATIDAGGGFSATFEAPVDFGFSHDVTVEQGDRLLNKAAFRLDPRVSISPTSGPLGTPITIRMEGVGWANLENSWLVTYDNQFTGLLSAVTTQGVAVGTIPATGDVGAHIIRVVHGSFTVPYLNMQQSPRPDRPTFTLDFNITEGAPVAPLAADQQALAAEKRSAPEGDGPAIWTDPGSATVGAQVTVYGRGLPKGVDVTMTWSTVIGNRVGGTGWDESTSDAFHVTTTADGSFQSTWQVPDDLGGPHRIAAVASGTALAETSLVITPSLISASMGAGPQGADIVIHLKGVGWTETANIYNLVYDNGFLGYVCGFNSQGDVVITLPAAGGAGWHFIDLYPGIYKGEDVPGVQNFRIPQLTAEQDHPGERLPVFRLAFEITD
ncbi:MAG TPA: hypothetical protein VJ141_01360 [Candidatus Limnocylindrales bacterium]|nr:hypothetical protein [Candidatus Limnocylindrales bacterium]